MEKNRGIEMVDLKFKGKYIIKSKIEVLTGLHIGASNSNFEIGGVDNPVIKDVLGRPYIPGSSLKGKLRSLLETIEGYLKNDKLVYIFEKDKKEKEAETDEKGQEIRIHMCDEKDCAVCNIFGRNHGSHKSVADGKKRRFDRNITPTRIIVRDSYLLEDSITQEMHNNLDLEWTEVKFENSLDRITSFANPRQNERVPRGAKFSSEIILNVFNDEQNKYLMKVLQSMKLLEDDYLGGSGSRGYGKVAFKDIKIWYRSSDDYETGNFSKEPVVQGDNLESLYETLKNLE